MTINHIEDWFKKAIPFPTDENFNIQLGCHIEELVEMLESLVTENDSSDELYVKHLILTLSHFSESLKKGKIKLTIEHRLNFLDSICDQIVTATGLAYMSGSDVCGALKEVALSNDSKFDDKGEPIFDENGKITKGPQYREPDLSYYV